MNLHLATQVQSRRFRAPERPTLQTRGLAVARLLSGAWRAAGDVGSRPAGAADSDIARLTDFSEAELTEITPLLCRSGAGALAWWRLRDTALADCPSALELREVYRRHRLSALLHEREISALVSLLRAEGIEAVLIKGWAIARRYPDSALRPYGDIDLCVRPDQQARAAQVLARNASLAGPFVDLHSGFTRIGQTKTVQSPESGVHSLSAVGRLWTQDSGLRTKGSGEWEELFARSHVVECGGEPVRVLGDEDHLRLLCLHLLRSGAHRPAWLCDVALLLEAVNSFDWDMCLGRNSIDTNWVGVAVRLAHELLGADIRQTPFANQQTPRWLAPAVLEQWGGKRAAQKSAQSLRALKGRKKVAKGKRIARHPWIELVKRLRPVGAPEMSRTPSGCVQSTISFPGWRATRLPLAPHADCPRGDPALATFFRPFRARRLGTVDWGPWTSLYRRWDNPIRATAAVGGRFDERSRLPYRLLESAMRLAELPAQVRNLVASGQ